MTVVADDPRPPSVQVAAILRGQIEDGSLRAGQRMPSIRDLSKQFDVSAGAIQNAIRLLREESLVYSAGNRGTFVRTADDAQDESSNLGRQVARLTDQVRELTDRVTALERSGAVHVSNNA